MRPRIYICGDEKTYFHYARAVLRVGGIASFTAADTCDGLLLPGGGDIDPHRYGQENTASRNVDSALDAREFALLDRFLAAGKPILGVCRGMQLLNVYFGGTLVQDCRGHEAIDGADRLHRVENTSGLFRRLFGKNCIVNSAHHQIVARVGSGLTVGQRASGGVVEALCHKALPVWGVQWHPERLPRKSGEIPLADGLALYRAFLRSF